MKTRFDDRLWEAEEMKPEEIPEELKESGAVNVRLRDVRMSIGKDRAGWKLTLEAELHSLMENRRSVPSSACTQRGTSAAHEDGLSPETTTRYSLEEEKGKSMCMW